MNLTPELEKKITELLAAGFNAAEIAEKLGVHRVTVQRYRKVFRDRYGGEKQ